MYLRVVVKSDVLLGDWIISDAWVGISFCGVKTFSLEDILNYVGFPEEVAG